MNDDTKEIIARLRAIDLDDDHDLYINASILTEAADEIHSLRERIAELEAALNAWKETTAHELRQRDKRIVELEAIVIEHQTYSKNQARRITHLEQALRRQERDHDQAQH